MNEPQPHHSVEGPFGRPFLTPAGAEILASRAIPSRGAPTEPVAVASAGTELHLVGLDASEIAALQCREAGVSTRMPQSDTGRSWQIELRRAEPDLFVPLSELRDPGSFWDYFLKIRPRARDVQFAGLDFYARLLRPPTRRVVGWIPRDAGPFRVRQVVLNLLRVATAFAVAEKGGLLLHSASLVRDGVAVVCPGRSGAGKSTLSARGLAAGWRVLSDELNVLWLGSDDGSGKSSGDVRRGDACAYVEQVPFTGDLGRVEEIVGRFPVAALLPLVRTGRDELLPISPAELYGYLVAESVFANSDPETLSRVESTAAALARAAVNADRVQALSFTPDGSLAGLDGLAGAMARAA